MFGCQFVLDPRPWLTVLSNNEGLLVPKHNLLKTDHLKLMAVLQTIFCIFLLTCILYTFIFLAQKSDRSA